jgi:hypothetical protein
MTKTKIRKEFEYLNRLRESGAVNMFGAGDYLVIRFGMDRRTARQTLLDWMQWVEENPSNRDL